MLKGLPPALPTRGDTSEHLSIVNNWLYSAHKQTPLALTPHPERIALKAIANNPAHRPPVLAKYGSVSHKQAANGKNPSISHLSRHRDNLGYLYNESKDLSSLTADLVKKCHLFCAKLNAATHGGTFTTVSDDLSPIQMDITRTVKNAFLVHRSLMITQACLRYELCTAERLIDHPSTRKANLPPPSVIPVDPLSISACPVVTTSSLSPDASPFLPNAMPVSPPEPTPPGELQPMMVNSFSEAIQNLTIQTRGDGSNGLPIMPTNPPSLDIDMSDYPELQ
jgi:hypothetical protein